jgi:hypothetical protein
VFGSLGFCLFSVENSLTTTAEEASMYTSTAPHDLAGIKDALELGVALAALVLAVAAHGGTRLAADFTAAPGIAAMNTQGIATLRWNLYSLPGMIGRQK